MKRERKNKLAQGVQAWRLDKAIDAAVTKPPVVQAVHDIADEAQVDATFVETLAARLEKRYAATTAKNPDSVTIFTDKMGNLGEQSKRRNLVMRLSWGATVICTVIVTLALVLFLRPTALPAERILADAIAATARRPGTVEHIVVENHLKIVLADAASEQQQFYIVEEWRQLEASHKDAVLTTARSTRRYSIADVKRQLPLIWTYESGDKVCYLSREIAPDGNSRLTHSPGSDTDGCISATQSVRPYIPELTSPNIETGLQLWLKRLQNGIDTLDNEETTFFGKPAFGFSETSGMARFTLYVDPDTAFPLGFVAETPTYNLTQIVHIYELIPVEDLTITPFLWPPVVLEGGVEN